MSERHFDIGDTLLVPQIDFIKIAPKCWRLVEHLTTNLSAIYAETNDEAWMLDSVKQYFDTNKYPYTILHPPPGLAGLSFSQRHYTSILELINIQPQR